MRLTGVGFFIAACILIGTFAGLWLDSKLDTRPIFMLVGLIIGLIVAGFGVYQMLLPLMDNKNNSQKRENG